jgi:hypothetical protein
MDEQTKGVYATLSNYLRDLGLGQLFSVDGAGNPSGWLWNQLQSGIDTAEELRIRLEATDVYRDRFGVIVEQQRRAAAGEPVRVMSPAEVIEYENTARQMMSMAGMPAWFYDEPSDFSKLMLADMSLAEVQARVVEAYDYVQAAPQEVRDAFDSFYGVGQGDGALATWALDPERTVRDVTKATRTAYAAGMANRFDITIDRATAERIADLPTTEEGIVTGLRNVARQKNVFNEGITEVNDITTRDGVASAFEGDADASRDIERRLAERDSINRSSTGGAVITNTGVVGAGSS